MDEQLRIMEVVTLRGVDATGSLGEQLRAAIKAIASLANVSKDRVSLTQEYDGDHNMWVWSVSIRYIAKVPRGRRDYAFNACGFDANLIEAVKDAIAGLPDFNRDLAERRCASGDTNG